MQRADWMTFIGALVIVAVLAIGINFLNHADDPPAVTETSETSGQEYQWDTCTDGTCCNPKTHYLYDYSPEHSPNKISLNNDYNKIYAAGTKGYPRLSFPAGMTSSTGYVNPEENPFYVRNTGYASSDLFQNGIWNDVAEFAYMYEESVQFKKISGFSEIFGSPYNEWRINVSVTAVPGMEAYTSFKWVLVDSATGDVITGGEVKPDNPMLKKVTVKDHRYYLMIDAENIQSYRFGLETPSVAYMQAHISPKISDTVFFLDTMERTDM